MKTILLLVIILISGCSDQAIIKFENSVDQIQDAEFQIKSAVSDIATISKFEWEKDQDNSRGNRHVNISVNAKSGVEDYTVEKVIERLANNLAFQEPDVTLSVEITETEQSALDSFDVQHGDVTTTKVKWMSANAGIYYTEGDSSLFGQAGSDFYCAIRAPLETSIPALTYNQELAAENNSTYALALAQLMGYELLGQKKSIEGLSLDDVLYRIQLQPGRDSDDYKYALLIFEHLGKKKVNPNFRGFITPPNGHSESSCLEFIRTKTGSNLFGVAGNVAAENNVVSVLKI